MEKITKKEFKEMRKVYNNDFDVYSSKRADDSEAICVVNKNWEVTFYYVIFNPMFKHQDDGEYRILVFDSLLSLIDFFAENEESKIYREPYIYKEFKSIEDYYKWYNNLEF